MTIIHMHFKFVVSFLIFLWRELCLRILIFVLDFVLIKFHKKYLKNIARIFSFFVIEKEVRTTCISKFGDRFPSIEMVIVL